MGECLASVEATFQTSLSKRGLAVQQPALPGCPESIEFLHAGWLCCKRQQRGRAAARLDHGARHTAVCAHAGAQHGLVSALLSAANQDHGSLCN